MAIIHECIAKIHSWEKNKTIVFSFLLRPVPKFSVYVYVIHRNQNIKLTSLKKNKIAEKTNLQHVMQNVCYLNFQMLHKIKYLNFIVKLIITQAKIIIILVDVTYFWNCLFSEEYDI